MLKIKYITCFLRNKRPKFNVGADNFWHGNIKKDMFMKTVFRWEMEYNFESTNDQEMIVDFRFT